MKLLIHVIMHILEYCWISSFEPLPAGSTDLLLFIAAAIVLKALTDSLKLIHNNLVPVILSHITVNSSSLKSRRFSDLY